MLERSWQKLSIIQKCSKYNKIEHAWHQKRQTTGTQLTVWNFCESEKPKNWYERIILNVDKTY